MRRQSGFLLALTASVAFLLGLVAAGSRSAGEQSRALARAPEPQAQPLTVSTAAAPVPAGAGVDFSVVAARVNAAVVNIDAATRGSERPQSLRRFQREPADDATAPHEGSGSGFIIDRAGYILTNHHVIEDADRVTVTLADGRVFRASVVGTDPAIDVALLQIPAAGSLPVAAIGDSDGLRAGEWVCAIGNPLGYVHSVTVGVVSFLGRKLFDPSLDAFIQTDAAISFGNSGGPLINSRAQVVGITTAISSTASNIGFAIPIGQVMGILNQLKEHGRVSRGYLGADVTDASPQLRQALRMGSLNGALVQDVIPDTPADHAGLRVYDLITAIDGRAIRSDDDLTRYVFARPPGSVSRLSIWREGASRALPVRFTERPLPRTARSLSAATRTASAIARQIGAPLGLSVTDLDASMIRRFGMPDSLVGVLITDVDAAGPARLARVHAGEVLLEINRHRVASTVEFRAMSAALRPGETVALLIYDRLSDQRTIHAVSIDPQ